jgi:hypothetical protein
VVDAEDSVGHVLREAAVAGAAVAAVEAVVAVVDADLAAAEIAATAANS